MKVRIKVTEDAVLKAYVADMLYRIWLYPRDIRNFTAKELEQRIASQFGRTA